MTTSNYTVTYAKGDTTPKTLDITDEVYSDKLPIDLFGRNAVQYGNGFWTNLVRLVENFYSKTEPRNPIKGQLWYDGTDLKLCTTAATTLVSQATYESTYSTYKSNAVWISISTSGAVADNNPVTKKYVDDAVAGVLTGITGDVSISSAKLAKVTGINGKTLADPTTTGQVITYNGHGLEWAKNISIVGSDTQNAAIRVNGTVTSTKQNIVIDLSTTTIQLTPDNYAGKTSLIAKNCNIANSAWSAGNWFKLINTQEDDVTVHFDAGSVVKISNGLRGGIVINSTSISVGIQNMICVEFICVSANNWIIVGNAVNAS